MQRSPAMAPATDTPALRVRRLLRSAFFWFEPKDPREERAEYRAFLRQQLHRAQSDLGAAEFDGNQARIQAERGAVFVAAAGLGTYGDLELVILALVHLPRSPYIRHLAGALPGFLPLPPGLDPVRDAAGAVAWLRTNRSRLHWVPESHFELRERSPELP